MSQQTTAVEFLKDKLESILELYNSEWDKVYQALEQAKQMEKEQIVKAVDSNFNYDNNGYPTLGEQYYNETYGNTDGN